MAIETCGNCGCDIGRWETPYIWNQNVVCRSCYSKLQLQGGKSRGLQPWGALIATITVVAAGICLLIRRNERAANAPPSSATISARALPNQSIETSNSSISPATIPVSPLQSLAESLAANPPPADERWFLGPADDMEIEAEIGEVKDPPVVIANHTSDSGGDF